jgi:hypothetical protein
VRDLLASAIGSGGSRAEALQRAIERRFAATCVHDLEGVRADVEVDDVTYRVHAQMIPFGAVVVALPCTDGFELSLSWTDRDVGTRAPHTFDDSCLVETNDVALAGMWLDREAQSALLASRYTSGTPDSLRTTAPMLRDGGWHHELRDDRVTATRRDPEPSPERVVDLVATSIAIASRPLHWARWFAPLATALGAEAPGRVELGGKPIMRVRRGRTDVVVRLLRRLGPADPGRLRTVVTAHRDGSGGEVLTLVAPHLPHARPPLDDAGASSLRIDFRARLLLDAARPSATVVRHHDVAITFDGVCADIDRLGAAIQLAAYWAADRGDAGPYR